MNAGDSSHQNVFFLCDLLGAFGWSRKAPVSFVMSVRLSVRPPACISGAPTERVCMKFGNEDFHGNLSRNSRFGSDLSKISVTFREDLSNIYSCCQHNFDRLCGLVVRVSGYRYRGPGFDPRRYQIF